MFGRFLSFLGFIPGLSGFSGLAGGYGYGSGSGSGEEEDMEAGGEASVSFTPGKRLSSVDAEETPDSRQARITDRDLVWPGKIETIQISNPEPIAYRFDLTVTDLNPAFYIRRPPQGGIPQREGGILLQPGEEASFEVVFVPPPTGEKLKTRTFGFVLTCFDPRRSGDPGEIVQDLPLRWVGLPTESDLQITAVPPRIVTRPWRREARFSVRLANKSFLPPTLGMTILRAPTKEALERDAETVGSIQQVLAARTPGVWQCLLPPPARRGSYYATVRGAAQAAESISTPLGLPRPVLIRYVPWLRMGRDWAFLIGTLLFLVWLVWGFPVEPTPVVRVTLNFGGKKPGWMPRDSQLKDLTAQMILLDEHGHDQEGGAPISSVVVGNAFEFTGPKHWYGCRLPFGRPAGWNHWSHDPQRFRITVAPAEAEKSAFKRYDLNALQADGSPSYNTTEMASLSAPWVKTAAFTAPAVHGVIVNLQLNQLEALTGKDLPKVTVTYTLGGHDTTATFPMSHDPSGGLRPITLDLTDAVPLGESRPFTVKVTAEGFTSNPVQEFDVQRGEPRPITLTFFRSAPPKTVSGPTTGAGPGGPNRGGSNAGEPHPGGQQGGVQSPVTPQGPLPSPVKPASHGGKPLVTSHPGIPSGIGHPLQPIPYHPPIPTSGTQFRPPEITPPPANPPIPDNLRAQAVSPYQINVSWRSIPGGGLYLLYRSGGSGGSWPLTTHNTFFSDTGLTPGTIYNYRVQSKQGTRSSDPSTVVRVLVPPLVTAPAKVTLTVTAKGRDIHAVLEFANISSQVVYLNKVKACEGGKIGDDVFIVQVDGVPLSFTGQKSKQPATPGLHQFSTLAAGEKMRHEVTLNHSYGFPPGTRHVYSVTYSAQHSYGVQALLLTSDPVTLDTTQ